MSTEDINYVTTGFSDYVKYLEAIRREVKQPPPVEEKPTTASNCLISADSSSCEVNDTSKSEITNTEGLEKEDSLSTWKDFNFDWELESEVVEIKPHDSEDPLEDWKMTNASFPFDAPSTSNSEPISCVPAGMTTPTVKTIQAKIQTKHVYPYSPIYRRPPSSYSSDDDFSMWDDFLDEEEWS